MVGVVVSLGVQMVVLAGTAVRLVLWKGNRTAWMVQVREVPRVSDILKLLSAVAMWMAMPARRG